jgi:hypothetical protein
MRYKNQHVSAAEGNHRCILQDDIEQLNTYCVCGQHKECLMLNFILTNRSSRVNSAPVIV